MLKHIQILALHVLVLTLLIPGLQAKTYLSLSGQFHITYPDDWEQIDFNTVDLFLARSEADPSIYEYDAVLAPSSSSPFFAGDYLILTIDTVGELTSGELDSVLNEFSESFQAGITDLPLSNAMADLKSNAPSYDVESKVITVLNDILLGQETVKKNLVMVKFYEKGVANFYFYSTDSLFETSKHVFQNIVASFSTENLDAALPREDVKVADIETDTEGFVKADKSRTFL
jgi:hypothetical protein